MLLLADELAGVLQLRQCLMSMQAGYRVLGLDIASQEDPVLQHADYEFVTTDIGSIEQTQQIAAKVGQQGGLHVLINNAGIADPFLPENQNEKLQHWTKVIQTNLTGTHFLAKSFTAACVTKNMLYLPGCLQVHFCSLRPCCLT